MAEQLPSAFIDLSDFVLVECSQARELDERGGVYAFVTRSGAQLPSILRSLPLARMPSGELAGLLYVGQTAANLQYRLMQHVKSAQASCYRGSLGLMLLAELDLEVRGWRRGFEFRNEAPLSRWMQANTVMAVRYDDDAEFLERKLLEQGGGALNLQRVPKTQAREMLKLMRHMARGAPQRKRTLNRCRRRPRPGPERAYA